MKKCKPKEKMKQKYQSNKIKTVLSHKQLSNNWQKAPKGQTLHKYHLHTLIRRAQNKPGSKEQESGNWSAQGQDKQWGSQWAEELKNTASPVQQGEFVGEKSKKYKQKRPDISITGRGPASWSI